MSGCFASAVSSAVRAAACSCCACWSSASAVFSSARACSTACALPRSVSRRACCAFACSCSVLACARTSASASISASSAVSSASVSSASGSASGSSQPMVSAVERSAATSSPHLFSSAAASSLSRFCSARYFPVRKIWRKIALRSSVWASSRRRNSPCAIMAMRENCARSTPMTSVTAAVTSRVFVMTRPSGIVSSASAFCTVVPVPRVFGRVYSGLRRTV